MVRASAWWRGGRLGADERRRDGDATYVEHDCDSAEWREALQADRGRERRGDGS